MHHIGIVRLSKRPSVCVFVYCALLLLAPFVFSMNIKVAAKLVPLVQFSFDKKNYEAVPNIFCTNNLLSDLSNA